MRSAPNAPRATPRATPHVPHVLCGSRLADLGEIVQAVALALPGSLVGRTAYYRALPWLYPLYYVALFIPRQMDDDEQLRAKYGVTAFDEYRKRVPSRIVPGVW